jgi:hypothetical protein
MSTESLTSNLLLEVNKSAQEFFRWGDQQIDKLETSDLHFEQNLEEFENQLNVLKENEVQLENLRYQQEHIKAEQTNEIQLLQDELMKYQQVITDNVVRLKELEDEKLQESVRLEGLLKLQKEAYKTREKRLNDLTRGVRLYRFLGLEFEKAENDCMRFSFTQIDPSDPLKPFQFLLLVDQNDLYRLVETNPSLEMNYANAIIDQLNRDNNISYFVVNMRRAFQKTL